MKHALQRSIAAAAWSLVVGCSVGALDLVGKNCPCADGYRCDRTTQRCVQIQCPSGLDFCSGETCTDLRNDPNNCGACGNVCRVNNGAGACDDGVCVVALCPPYDSACTPGALTCTNSPTSASCGSCDTACPAEFECRGFDGFFFCSCVDAATCGSGADACLTIPFCSTGQCDIEACSCGGQRCSVGETCVGGVCSCGTAPSGKSCLADGLGFCCRSGCSDAFTDAENCGGCGRRCPAGFVCSGEGTIGRCTCTKDADCDAGGKNFRCNDRGLCECDGVTCALDAQRCYADGTCN